MSNGLSKYKDFEGKKILVVDDFPEFRTAIKRMVEAFGGEDVETASNGEDAITKIKSKRYDIMLCDYNLGDGKDGQQVLEEAKYTNSVRESQSFIMLTAENTAEMVMGALECEPDGYLVKPFTKEMVHNRLIKVATVKDELKEIHRAIEDKDYRHAIELCDQKLEAGCKMAVTYLKLKGALLIKEERYIDAQRLYAPLTKSKKLPWVYMGLGLSYYYQGKYDEALKNFEAIVEISQVNVEGYDWIARTLAAKEDFTGAQVNLEKAVQLSSKAILRQQELGDMAYKNEDYEVATKAYKAAVLLGKHSCHRRAKDFICYAQLLIKTAQENEGRLKARCASDAVTTLESLSNLYLSDKKIQATSCVLQSVILPIASRKDKGRVMANKALEYIEKYKVELDKELMLQLAESLVFYGEEEKGVALKEKYE